MEEKDPNAAGRRPWLVGGGIALVALLLVAVWRLFLAGGEITREPLPEDPAARAALFKKDLKENPTPRPPGRRPLRDAYKAWLEARGGSFAEPVSEEEAAEREKKKETPPPVVDFGTQQFPSAPAEPERIGPNDLLDEEDLRHPEIYFEVAESYPDMNLLSERRQTLDFFRQYRDQLKGDLQNQIVNATPATVAETRAAIERYDEAIEKLEKIVEEQVRAEGEPAFRR